MSGRPRSISVADVALAYEMATEGVGWTRIGRALGYHPERLKHALKYLKTHGYKKARHEAGQALAQTR